MKRLSIAALFAFSTAFSSMAHAADAKVIPFVKKGVDPLIVLNITSLVASELDFMGAYDDVEQLEDYPGGYSLSCLSKTSCMRTVGKALGSDFVLAGSVGAGSEAFDVYMVLFDVNQGTFVRKKTFKVDKAPEKMADSMGAYVQELITGKSRAQVVQEQSVASVDEFAQEEDDFEDLDFDFDDGTSSARVSTPGNSNNELADFEEEPEDPGYENRRAEDERILAEQRREEEARRAEEQRLIDEEARRVEERRLREEQQRAEEEQHRRDEERRRANEQKARKKEEDRQQREQEKARKEEARQAAETADREREEARRRQAQEDTVVDEYEYDETESDDFADISFGSSVSVDEIEFGSAVSVDEDESYDDLDAPEEATSSDRYESLDESHASVDPYDEDDDLESSSDDAYYSENYYDDLESYEPSAREVAEARGSARDEESSRSSNNSGSSRSSSSSRQGSRSNSSQATISGTYMPHDPRIGITARAGYSRYQSWNFVSYGAEVSIPVSNTIFVQIGLAGYSVNRDVPPEFQQEIGDTNIWNTIVPFNLGFIYQATKNNIRPYGGLDITLTPYTRSFKVAVGARARLGVDFMIAETFGFNLNTGLGVWYGSDFDQIETGVSNFGFIPSVNAGTVLKF